MTENMNASIKIQGVFTLEIYNKNHELVRKLEFPNLILNSGLNAFGQGTTGIWGRVLIGTGTSAPLVTDTAMQSLSSSTTSLQSQSMTKNTSTLPYYFGQNIKRRFSAGQLNGNYSEIGIGWGTSSGQLFSRSLIKDGNGNPTTITVLSDEFLDVTYDVRFIIADQPVISSASISGVPAITSCSVLPYNITNTNYSSSSGYENFIGYQIAWIVSNWLSAAPSKSLTDPIGCFLSTNTSHYPLLTNYGNTNPPNSVQGASLTKATYITDNFYADYTASFGLNNGNGTYQTLIIVNAWFVMQILFNAPIVKTSSQTLTVNVRLSWDRYTP